MQELAGFQRDFLVVIARLYEPHGLAIKEEIEAYYDRTIAYRHLYPNLDTFAEEG